MSTHDLIKMADLRERKANELREMLVKARETAYEARFNHASQAMQKTHVLGGMRRNVARIATALRQVEDQKAKAP